MKDTNRWFIDVNAPGAAELKPAFAWFLRQIASSPDQRGLLAVPGKGNLTNTGIGTLLGPARVKKLSKDKRVQIQNIVIELMTERINPYSWSGPVLAVYPDKKLLDAVDSLRTPSIPSSCPGFATRGQSGLKRGALASWDLPPNRFVGGSLTQRFKLPWNRSPTA